nr:MAG: DMT family transporter [Hyphomicrobiales bacterium]
MESEPTSPLPTLPQGAPPKSDSVSLGYLYAAAGAALFSTKAILIKLAYAESIGTETLLALRMGLALPFYLAIGALSLRDRSKRKSAWPPTKLIVQSAVIGALGYWLASYADFLGLQYITAQFERLILFTYPLFVVLFGAMFFGQSVRAHMLLAFALSYAGLALIFTENFSLQGEDAVIGSACVLAAAIAFALYQLLAREVIAKMGPRLFTCIAMLGASIAAFLQFFLVEDASAILVGPTLLYYGLLIAVFATVLPSFFLSEALHRISAQASGIIGTLSPLVTILLAAAILREPVTWIGMAGTLLVLGSVGWFTLSKKP